MPTNLPLSALAAGALLFAVSSCFAAGPPGAHGSEGAPASGEPPVADEFSALDLNGDGAVSRGEIYLLTSLARRYYEADVNGDGEISRSEFSAFELKVPKDRPMPPRLQGTLAQWQLFDTIDKNSDDHITHEEAKIYTELQDGFAQADGDRNGAVDRSEFAAFQYQRQYDKATSPESAFE